MFIINKYVPGKLYFMNSSAYLTTSGSYPKLSKIVSMLSKMMTIGIIAMWYRMRALLRYTPHSLMSPAPYAWLVYVSRGKRNPHIKYIEKIQSMELPRPTAAIFVLSSRNAENMILTKWIFIAALEI